MSNASATALWEFLRPIQGPVHVTVAAAVRRKPRSGIRVHRSRTLRPRDITRRRHGIATRRHTGDLLEAAPEAVVADLRQALGRAS